MNTIIFIIIVVILICISIVTFLLLKRHSKKRKGVDGYGPIMYGPIMSGSSQVHIGSDASVVELVRQERAKKEAELAAKRESFRKKYKISIAHPRLLSKGYASLFVVQIYLPSLRSQAKK